MKSIRLNKKLRQEIISNIRQAYLLKNKEPEYKTKSKYFSELVVSAMRKEYIAASNALLEKAKEMGLPYCVLNKKANFTYAIDGEFGGTIYFSDTNQFDKGNFHLTLSEGCYFNLSKDMEGVLGDAYREYLSKTKRLKKAKEAYDKYHLKLDNYMADVINVIEGVNTTGQLLEAWPECERFIPSGIVDPSAISLPASVNISQLNKCI